MNLQRKFFTRVENFDEQRKACRVGNPTEDRLSILYPEFVQCFALQRSITHDTLRFRTIDNLPRFADRDIRRELFAVQIRKSMSAPNPFLEKWFERYSRRVVAAHQALHQTSNIEHQTSFPRLPI